MQDILQYTPSILANVDVHKFSSSKKAAYFLYKNKNIFTWNILRSFEGTPISLPDTETILNGFSVDSLNLNDMLKVKAYGRAIEQLCDDIQNNVFVGDKYDLIELHRIAARSEIDKAHLGLFRREHIILKNVKWRPLDYSILPEYWKYVEEKINSTSNILEKSLVTFLRLCRIQFFPDVNKRTALLFANGLLLKNGFAPFMIETETMADFSNHLHNFYETGNADAILKFLVTTVMIKPEDSIATNQTVIKKANNNDIRQLINECVKNQLYLKKIDLEKQTKEMIEAAMLVKNMKD